MRATTLKSHRSPSRAAVMSKCTFQSSGNHYNSPFVNSLRTEQQKPTMPSLDAIVNLWTYLPSSPQVALPQPASNSSSGSTTTTLVTAKPDSKK